MLRGKALCPTLWPVPRLAGHGAFHLRQARRLFDEPVAATETVAPPEPVAPLNPVESTGSPPNIVPVILLTWGTERIEDGQFLRKWGSNGNCNGQFDTPIGIAVDGRANIYMSGVGRNRVQVFDGEGRFLRKWDSKVAATASSTNLTE